MKEKYVWEVVNKNELETTEEDAQETELEQYIATKLHELWKINNHNSVSVWRFLREKKAYWEIRVHVENCENNESLRKRLTYAIHTAMDER